MRVVFAILLLGAIAHAQPRVEMTISGPEDAQSFLQPTVDELLGPIAAVSWHDRLDVLDLRVVVFPPEHPQAALARVWIERGTDRVTIFLVDSPWERILVRHVPAPDGLDETVREQVGVIVRAAIEALIDGAHIGITREQAQGELHVEPPPIIERTPPAPIDEVHDDVAIAPPSAALIATGDVFAGYCGQFFADGPTVRSAIAIVLALRLGSGPVRPIALLGADFWPTSSTEAAGVRLDLRTWVLRAELGVDVEVIDGTSIRGTAGLALDATAVEPSMIGATRVADAWDALGPLITLRGAVVQRVWEWIGVTAAIVLDVDPVDTRYLVAGDAGEETVIDPWLIRPALWIGAGALWR
jgi:hypothetical protein